MSPTHRWGAVSMPGAAFFDGAMNRNIGFMLAGRYYPDPNGVKAVAEMNISLLVSPQVAERLESAASADGVTVGQAASLAVTLGALLPAHARQLLRLVVEEGGDEAMGALIARVIRAISVVGHSVVEKRLTGRAPDLASALSDTTAMEDAAMAVELVRQAWERRAQNSSARPSDG